MSKRHGKRRADQPAERSALGPLEMSTAFPGTAASTHSFVCQQLPERASADPTPRISAHHGSHEAKPMKAGTETHANQKFRYCDYHSFMSLADFLAWVGKNDGSEPDISHIHGR